ncbi:MAG: slr1658 superfamily regulator [Actinomycetota bacterium]
MSRIFGEFWEESPACQEYLTLVFSPSSLPLKKRWVHNGLSADFLAGYFSTFFPGGEGKTVGVNQQAEVKSAVSYIANELLENAMKFYDDRLSHQITITLQLHAQKLVFFATNTVKPEAVNEFQFFIQELIGNDATELYIRHLEGSSVTASSHQSRLGFLSMMNDYLAKLGWKFEQVQKNPEIIIVTTMVQLEV